MKLRKKYLINIFQYDLKKFQYFLKLIKKYNLN